MKCILWILLVTVAVFAFTFDIFAQFAESPLRGGRSRQPSQVVPDRSIMRNPTERFVTDAAARSQPAARAEAEAIMRAEATRRTRAGEKAPSLMGYELGMLQSDIDKKAEAAARPPRTRSQTRSDEETANKSEDAQPQKEFVARLNSYTMKLTSRKYLDTEKRYPIGELRLTGDGKNIVQISVKGLPMDQKQMAEWTAYAVAVIEQKTGKKTDPVKEGGNSRKWNAKTYEVEISESTYDVEIVEGPGRGERRTLGRTMEIKVSTKSEHDSRTVKPAI